MIKNEKEINKLNIKIDMQVIMSTVVLRTILGRNYEEQAGKPTTL
jgi:hypothetical protein